MRKNSDAAAPPAPYPASSGHLLVTASSKLPNTKDLRRLMQRMGVEESWTEAAVKQLIHAATAANGWLAAHPDQAARLAADPASAVLAMQRAGLLSQPADQLLERLKSLGQSRDARPELRARRAAIGPEQTAQMRFAPKPTLQFQSPSAQQARRAKRTRPGQ